MGGFLKGYERHEEFMLPGDWVILIDYGIDTSQEEVSWGYEKGRSAYMRSKLYKQGILVDESIENNPNFVTYEDAGRLKIKGSLLGKNLKESFISLMGMLLKLNIGFQKKNKTLI